MSEISRACGHCGKPLQRKGYEKPHEFKKRQFCDHNCYGLARRLTEGNEHALDVLTPEACYWTGFLFADGCIEQRKHGQPIIKLMLSSVDIAHLEKFRAFFGIHTAIAVRPSHKMHNGYTAHEQVSTYISSQRLVNKLRSYGFQKNPRWPTEPRLLVSRDFWRGVVDGDGDICVVKKKRLLTVNLSGGHEMLALYADFLSTHCPNSPATVQPQRAIYQVKTTTAADALTMLRVLYKDCSVALDRKYALAMGYLNNPPEPISNPRTMRFKRREVGERYIAGESSLQLAEAYNTSPATILRILKALGIPARRKVPITELSA